MLILIILLVLILLLLLMLITEILYIWRVEHILANITDVLLISLINDSRLVHRELPLFLMLLMSLLILMSILRILLVQVRILVFQLHKSSVGIFVSLVLLGL